MANDSLNQRRVPNDVQVSTVSVARKCCKVADLWGIGDRKHNNNVSNNNNNNNDASKSTFQGG